MFNLRKHTLQENIISALIGTVIALAVILFNYDEIFAARLIDVTGYCCGTHGSHGDKLKIGHCAYRPEDYGGVLAIYKAEETETGYEMGEFITYLEIKDCGYGRPTGKGKSKILKGKTVGTIESGQQLDAYYPTYEGCVEFMRLTQGKVFVVEVDGEG